MFWATLPIVQFSKTFHACLVLQIKVMHYVSYVWLILTVFQGQFSLKVYFHVLSSLDNMAREDSTKLWKLYFHVNRKVSGTK